MRHTKAVCFLGALLLSAVPLAVVAQQPAAAGLNDFLRDVDSALRGAAGGDRQPRSAATAVGNDDTQWAGGGNRLSSASPLWMIFSRYPATSNDEPEWPKVAITITHIPPAQLESHQFARKPLPSECMRYSIRLWLTAKKPVEKFDNMTLCGSDFQPGISFSQLMNWKAFPINGKTAGQVRSGPKPPATKFPSSPKLDQWLKRDTGYYYIGHLLHSLGYDWTHNPDTRRVWVAEVRE